jgi:hypothetical protein
MVVAQEMPKDLLRREKLVGPGLASFFGIGL